MTYINKSNDIYKSDAFYKDASLFIVATPIGNLRDISLRALDILKSVEIIFCEDTRMTHRLVKEYDLQKQLFIYNDHNTVKQIHRIEAMMREGKSIALVSDAGTPLISDPGYRLVNLALAHEYNIMPIPGSSAPIAALSASGLPSNDFFFAGFLPVKEGQRLSRIQELKDINTTLIFFESSRRLKKSLKNLDLVLGAHCKCVIAREMTKIYEEFIRGTLSEVRELVEEREIKGEIVILIDNRKAVMELDENELDQEITSLLSDHSLKDAVALISEHTGVQKKLIYQRALKIQKQKQHDELKG